MSLTGVGLTYERQILNSAQQADYPAIPSSNAHRLALDDVMVIAQSYSPDKTVSVSFSNEINAPFVIKQGRKTLAYLNPFTGEKMAEPGHETKVFLSKLRAFHRWLTFDGTFSQVGRWINGYSNMIFLFLALSGLYLWLPAKFKTRAFKQKLILTKNHKSTHARNYQWHNTFGFYMAPILIVVTFTALFFSFKWPGDTLKLVASTHSEPLPKARALSVNEMSQQLSMQALFSHLVRTNPQWQSISFSLPTKPMNTQAFSVDMGNGGEPQKRKTIVMNTLNAEVVAQQEFKDMAPYRKARSYIRFLHTGEMFGLVGQTLAGLASLLACLLVYTGVSMSLKRWKNSRQ